MRKALLGLAFAALMPLAGARADTAGDFDYYVLSLSWSPGWCATEGRGQDAAQCAPGRNLGWILHGLWPQYERGYPKNCAVPSRAPSAAQTRAMSDIMGSSGLAAHEWKTHGTCSGLSAGAYFDLSRKAFEKITPPPLLKAMSRDARLSPSVLESAFMADNPGLTPGGITITCSGGRIREARICLTRDLQFRDCAPDVARDCSRHTAIFDAIR
ncbi:ribonuclease T2 [Pseudooceanicola sp. CBS1P-1]|uniref:Ribonuclease T n=1 Tax=Pseudooceanicola albus TaxID=2692189 RepID=A0A6L7GAY4_9RHOB|nr:MULTISPECIES: ribonuclease T2 [Pseudooceanicola]MBT9386402.1 ribonuclease T2 [Pseudooceanicola endophyticus]MXN20440.1 ribonuclease T [Pseudooceanicola albus]